MKILYESKTMDNKTLNLFLADLIGYRLQKELETRKKLNALSGDSKTLNAILFASKNSATGLTIENLISGIRTAFSFDIFSFKLNDVDVFQLVKEQMNITKGMKLEVYMNPIIFSTEIALKGQFMPGFRKKTVDQTYIDERMEKEEKSWMFKFEHDIKDYLKVGEYNKTILERG